MATVAVVGGFVGRPQNRCVRPLIGHLVGRRVRVLATPDRRGQDPGQPERHQKQQRMDQRGAHDANRIAGNCYAAPSPRYRTQAGSSSFTLESNRQC